MGNGLMAIVAGLAAQVGHPCSALATLLPLSCLHCCSRYLICCLSTFTSCQLAAALQFLVDTLALGPVAPFDAAAVVMVIGGLVVLATWPENYGDASNKHTLAEQLAAGARAIYNGERADANPELLLFILAAVLLLASTPGLPSKPEAATAVCRPEDCAAGGDAVTV